MIDNQMAPLACLHHIIGGLGKFTPDGTHGRTGHSKDIGGGVAQTAIDQSKHRESRISFLA